MPEERRSKFDDDLKETNGELKALQHSHNSLQLALIEKLGEINGHLSNLSIQFKNETETARNFRTDTSRDIEAIKADIKSESAHTKIEISKIKEKQVEFNLIAEGYKGIRPLLWKGFILFVSVLIAAIGSLAALIKGLV